MKVVKGFTRTVGGSGVGPSSVMGSVRGGVSNREVGGGLVTMGETVEGNSEGHTTKGGVGKANTGGKAHFGHAGHWWSRGGWVRHRGYGQLA